MSTLPRSFFQRCTVDVARDLLGKKIIWQPKPNTTLSAMIVETEAYLGLEDPACHSFHGKRGGRAETLYLDGGHAYIYLIYGMHFCLNAVTRSPKEPEAVLIRAAMPLEGVEVMRSRRPAAVHDWQIANGPGKLCQAFGLTREQNGLSLQDSPLTFAYHQEITENQILATTRIGVEYAGDAAEWPLRFCLVGQRAVSGPRTKVIS